MIQRGTQAMMVVLVALAVVVTVVAPPVGAAGDGLTDVSVDDAPNVSTDADGGGDGTDGLTRVADGGSPDVDAPTSVTDGGSTDDVTEGEGLPNAGADDDLPVGYDDIPLSELPVDLCTRPSAAPDLPDSPVENPAPVDPTNPPNPPVTQCDVFNPYDPPFDPTDVPDDPEATYNVYQREAGPDGVSIVFGGDARPDSNYPFGTTIVGVQGSPDNVSVVEYTRVHDGSTGHIVLTELEHTPGTKTGVGTGWVYVFERHGTVAIDCTGDVCTVSQPAPTGDQEIPTSPDSGGGADAPADIPCNVPSIPSPPALPVENPAPVDPTNPPNPPVGPCDVYDPNDLPTQQPDPDADYTVHEASQDGLVVDGVAAYNRSEGPRGFTILAISQDDDGDLLIAQYTRTFDGQTQDSAYTDIEHEPGTQEGQATANIRQAGENVEATADCDGDACTIEQNVAPTGEIEIPTGSTSGTDVTNSTDDLL